MNYSEAMQLILATALLAIPLGMLLGRLGGGLRRLLGRLLAPRYLHALPVRRRRVAAPGRSEHGSR